MSSSGSHTTSSSSGYEEFSEGFSPDEDQGPSTQPSTQQASPTLPSDEAQGQSTQNNSSPLTSDKAQDQSIQHTSPPLTSDLPDRSKKPPNLPPKYVRICPHYLLSFGQLHFMATQSHRKPNLSLDLFAKLHAPHDRRVFIHGREPSIYSSIYFSNTLSMHPGFELSSSWNIWCLRSASTNYSVDSIRGLLQRSNVWLCPHIALGSNWVVSTIFRLLKYNNRNPESSDGNTECCPACCTFLQVMCVTKLPLNESKARLIVNTKRRLGLGFREDDVFWQTQSVTSAGDRGSGSESIVQRGFSCGVQSLRLVINNPPVSAATNAGDQVVVGTPGQSS